jgi:hypothetical protein
LSGLKIFLLGKKLHRKYTKKRWDANQVRFTSIRGARYRKARPEVYPRRTGGPHPELAGGGGFLKI